MNYVMVNAKIFLTKKHETLIYEHLSLVKEVKKYGSYDETSFFSEYEYDGTYEKFSRLIGVLSKKFSNSLSYNITYRTNVSTIRQYPQFYNDVFEKYET